MGGAILINQAPVTSDAALSAFHWGNQNMCTLAQVSIIGSQKGNPNRAQ